MTRSLRAFIVLYVLLSVADLVLTVIGLTSGNIELNFFAAPWYNLWGAVGILVYKVILVGLIVLTVVNWWNRKSMRVMAWLALGGLVFVVTSNLLTVMN